ncbi:MAG: RNA polymerase sigma factor [Planctomycetota bacterium]
MPPTGGKLNDLLTELHREQVGLLLASLMPLARNDLAAAEDAVQLAFTSALEHWQKEVPRQPVAWLRVTARNKLLDHMRHQGRIRPEQDAPEGIEREQGSERQDDAVDSGIPDDRLRLLFTCCHPSLKPEAQVALTLTTLGGLRTDEVARAFLIEERTMAQRLTRAKRKIRDAGIPYRIPSSDDLPERLPGVLAALYLIFNEGYSASSGAALQRQDLCRDARRLARTLTELLPEQPEVRGLQALMAFQDSRRAARCTSDGKFLTLAEQDRSLWNQEDLQEGRLQLEFASRLGAPGTYTLQAALAAEHASAITAADTAWQRIVRIYDILLQVQDTPVIRLNRAVAVAESGKVEEALAILEDLQHNPALKDYLWLHSTHADLLERLDRKEEAQGAWRRALELAGTDTERDFLLERLDRP